MVTGELTFEDEATVHARETEATLCIDMDHDENAAYTYIGKDQAQKIVDHLVKVFKLSPPK